VLSTSHKCEESVISDTASVLTANVNKDCITLLGVVLIIDPVSLSVGPLILIVEVINVCLESLLFEVLNIDLWKISILLLKMLEVLIMASTMIAVG
jgi:hypothetical protein